MPEAFLLAGPNGAGKTTASGALLPPGVDFLNADLAAELLKVSGHPARGLDVAAGRAVLAAMRQAVRERRSFCLETNLAGRGMLRPISEWQATGYKTHLLFVALDDPDLAVRRVASRVAAGGHDVPELTIRRRYRSGLTSLFAMYLELVDDWLVIDNSRRQPFIVASGTRHTMPVVTDPRAWARLRRAAGAQ